MSKTYVHDGLMFFGWFDDDGNDDGWDDNFDKYSSPSKCNNCGSSGPFERKEKRGLFGSTVTWKCLKCGQKHTIG